MAHRLFREEAQGQRVCQMCRTPRGEWHPHHVIYQQWLRDNGHPIYDTRNSLRLCVDCHAHHHDRSAPVPLERLLDKQIEYAFILMGAFADDYLRRRYAGEDPRLEMHLEQQRP